MSKALDKLEATVNQHVKDGSATKNMTRDQLLDYSISVASALKAHLQFFNDIADKASKYQDAVTTGRKNGDKSQFIKTWSALYSGLIGVARARQDAKFSGALIEAAQATVMVLDEVAINVDKLFVDKTFNLYNTKISHVAIYGVLDNATTLAAFTENFIAAFFASCPSGQFKIAPYQTKFLEDNVGDVAEICCKMINGKLGKTFTAGIIRYKKSGNDVGILTSDNQSSAKFAKLGNEVSEGDMSAGEKGRRIFRLICDWFADLADNKARKNRALREQHKARVEFLQMELEGEDPNSERYKRIVKIIKNYNDMIDRLNQKIEKYENED